MAAIADQRLVDYGLWRPGSPDGVGDMYRGRITAQVPAMAGAFVALSASGAEGFLPDSAGAKGLTDGTVITVRITRAAQGGKGPRLKVTPTQERVEGPLGLVLRGTDPLRELAERYAEASVFLDDPALAADLRATLGTRIVLARKSFDDSIEEQVDALASSEVTLASGVRLSVYPTPALVAIDVDGGGALAGKAVQSHRALNAAALSEIARQIRLRNLSGAILVDLAGMKPKQRASLAPVFVAALADDPLRPRFVGFSGLGLAETVRPRVRPPLYELLSGPLAAGLAALRAIANASRAEPGRRLTLRAGPAVVTALQNDEVALADLARIAGQRLNLRSDPSLPADGYSIEALHG